MTGFARWRQSPPIKMRGCALEFHSEILPLTSANMNCVTLFSVPARATWVNKLREEGQVLYFGKNKREKKEK
jgi:hypothetical protein